MGDDELVEAKDPGEQSFIRKARKHMEDTKLIEHIVRWAVIAAVGAGSSMATRQVGDAEQNSVVNTNRAELIAMKDQLQMAKDGFRQLITVEVEEEENAREETLRRIERRLTWIEAKLDIVAPPAAAEAPPN